MRPILTLVLAAAACVSVALPPSLSAQALSPARTGPVIEGYGAVYDVPAPDFETPMGVRRVLFNVSASGDGPGELNPNIETLARYLNMHARAGVPRENMKLALVLHGGAGKDALTDEAYRRRFGVDNPNRMLLQELIRFGVRVVLCGQTQVARGFQRDEILPDVKVALSAMTALVELQDEGYRLIGS